MDGSGWYPAAVLYALRPDFLYLGVKDIVRSPRGFSFVVAIQLDGVEYIGYGSSKKKAKHQACQRALDAIRAADDSEWL